MNIMEVGLLKNKEKCCGCGSCILVCPVGAITMVPMELGCLYPVIDQKKCIRCGACERVCACTAERVAAEESAAYVAVAKEKQWLKNSASGGVFVALAHKIIDAGGVVFGCSMELVGGLLTPMHIGICEHEALAKLQGSKYVQSALGNTFSEIRQLLKKDQTVLFTGTPCQVDALKHYLSGVNTKKLYTLDLICHGVPSTELFQAYIKSLECKHKGPLISFRFRDKTVGKSVFDYVARYTYLDKQRTEFEQDLPLNTSSYYSFFTGAEIQRESCYACRYANLERVGDITIGDFWGIEQEHPECLRENGGIFDTTEGVSAILINGDKGMELLNQYGDELEIKESAPSHVTRWNRQLCNPCKHTAVREQLINAYNLYGYSGVEKIYRKQQGMRYYARLVKKYVKEILGK